MALILIIDDDPGVNKLLAIMVERCGHQTRVASNLADGWQALRQENCAVILLDVGLPDGSGLDLLPQISEMPNHPEVIIITGYGDPDGAELAIKSGAWAYLEKPVSAQMLELLLTRALEYHEVKLARRPPVALERGDIVGSSPRLKACLDLMAQAANTDAAVLITGATGTGKELFALGIHNNGRRARNSFVVVDCSAIPATLVESLLFGHEKGAFTGAAAARDGLIKQADGGTLFLDEVGELPLGVQKTFLRVLQEHRFRPLGARQEVRSDFRLVAATNRDLDQMVADGAFRQDLLYRIRSINLELPPLHDRREDIKDLVSFHLIRLAQEYDTEIKGLSAGFLETLMAYDWPGNVRELLQALDEAFAAGYQDPMLFPAHLPVRIRASVARGAIVEKQITPPDSLLELRFGRGPGPDLATPLPTLKEVKQDAERRYLDRLMLRTNWDIAAAGAASGLSRSRLYDLLKLHNIGKKSE